MYVQWMCYVCTVDVLCMYSGHVIIIDVLLQNYLFIRTVETYIILFINKLIPGTLRFHLLSRKK